MRNLLHFLLLPSSPGNSFLFAKLNVSRRCHPFQAIERKGETPEIHSDEHPWIDLWGNKCFLFKRWQGFERSIFWMQITCNYCCRQNQFRSIQINSIVIERQDVGLQNRSVFNRFGRSRLNLFAFFECQPAWDDCARRIYSQKIVPRRRERPKIATEKGQSDRAYIEGTVGTTWRKDGSNAIAATVRAVDLELFFDASSSRWIPTINRSCSSLFLNPSESRTVFGTWC